MKAYYTSIYNEGMIGEVLRHNTAEEAEKYLDKEWNRLTEREQKGFKSGTADSFKAFEIEATEEQLEQIEAGDIAPEELTTRIIKDMINVEERMNDMITVNGVLENLKKIIGEEVNYNDIICAFEDFEQCGESSVYCGESNNNGYDYIAYIDAPDSTSFCIKTDKNDIITDVWTVER